MNEAVQTEDLIEDEAIIEEEVDTTEELTDDQSEDSNEEAGEEPPKQSRSQNAKARLRRKNRELAEHNARIAEENRKLQEQFSALEQKVDGVINPPAQRPTRVDYDTEEDYEDALLDWKLQPSQSVQANPSAVNTAPEPKAEARTSSLPPEVQENWDDQLDNGHDKYEDFEDVMYSIKPENMTDPMANTIFESKVGAEIAYFLGKNPAEAERISRLGIAGQVRAIDKLSNKFKPSTSNAPEPISETKGGTTAVKDVDKMSPEEYRKMRRQQRAKK